MTATGSPRPAGRPRCSRSTTSPPTTSTCSGPITAARPTPRSRRSSPRPITRPPPTRSRTSSSIIATCQRGPATSQLPAHTRRLSPPPARRGRTTTVPRRLRGRRAHLDRSADPVQHRVPHDRPQPQRPQSVSRQGLDHLVLVVQRPQRHGKIDQSRQDVDLLGAGEHEHSAGDLPLADGHQQVRGTRLLRRPTTTNQTWYVYIAQSTAQTTTGRATPQQLMAVHRSGTA